MVLAVEELLLSVVNFVHRHSDPLPAVREVLYACREVRISAVVTADCMAKLVGSHDCILEAFVIGDRAAVECIIDTMGIFHVRLGVFVFR